LQKVDEVLDARAFKLFGLGKQQLVVLVHSGSRGLGESILRDYVGEHQASGSDPDSFAAAAYLQGHDLAVRWAEVNRGLLAQRFVQQLGAQADLLWQPKTKLWSSRVLAARSATWLSLWVMAQAVLGRWLTARVVNGPGAKPASVCASASACIS
jgi:hypothetical protein